MKKDIAVFAIISLLSIFIFAWMVRGSDFFMYKVFGLEYENARREMLEQSKAYNQGMIQELHNMQFEYVKATPSQRESLASIILHRTADFNLDQERVPEDLRQFVRMLRGKRAEEPINITLD